MMKRSDLIITHSSNGVSLIHEYVHDKKHVFFFPHPVTGSLTFAKVPKEYDILIWGSLVPYKGIDLFLDYLLKNNLQEKYSIRIVGKCNDVEYLNKLNAFSNHHIQIENRFIDEEDLQKMMSLSRIVLFSYNSDSILSSGALAESVSYGATVVGPHKAAFKDLANLKYVFSYQNFNQLIDLINNIISGKKTIPEKRFVQYLSEFHWSEFAKKLHLELQN
jgi:glycosyltransferase involved in cell wall biosynthesis